MVGSDHGSNECQNCLTWDRKVSTWDSPDLVPAGCGAWIYDRKCICINAKVSVKEWNTHGQLPGLWDLMVVLYWQTVVYVRTEFRIFRIFKFSFKLNFKYSIFWLLVDCYVKQSFDSCITNGNEFYPIIQKILYSGKNPEKIILLRTLLRVTPVGAKLLWVFLSE